MSKFLSKGTDVMSRFMTKNVWRLPPEEFIALYNKYMLKSRNHLV